MTIPLNTSPPCVYRHHFYFVLLRYTIIYYMSFPFHIVTLWEHRHPSCTSFVFLSLNQWTDLNFIQKCRFYCRFVQQNLKFGENFLIAKHSGQLSPFIPCLFLSSLQFLYYILFLTSFPSLIFQFLSYPLPNFITENNVVRKLNCLRRVCLNILVMTSKIMVKWQGLAQTIDVIFHLTCFTNIFHNGFFAVILHIFPALTYASETLRQ